MEKFIVCAVFTLGLFSGYSARQVRDMAPVVISFTSHFEGVRLHLPENSRTALEVSNVESSVRFLVFEAHTQKYSLIISSKADLRESGQSANGSDVGLVSILNRYESHVKMWLYNINSEEITALVNITPYQSRAPVPGGCNMEFPAQISPFLRIYSSSVHTRVEFQHARVTDTRVQPLISCDRSIFILSYDLYVHFLPENDFSEMSYLNGIQAMISLANVKKYGTKVKTFNQSPKTRVILLSYPGQGVIYNVLVRYTRDNELYEAVYVPGSTYGCSFHSEVDGCGQLTGDLAMVLAIVMAIVGLFICFRGHRFFKTEMMYFGFLASAFLTFVLLTRFTEIGITGRNILTVILGIMGGLLWVAIWWIFGVPVISMLLVGLVIGFLLTSVVFFTPVGNVELLRDDFSYWLIFSCGILFIPIMSLLFQKLLSIVGSSIMGGYAFIVVIDRYIGTTLSYIILNVVKRAVRDDLSYAFNSYPFQTNDIILSITWGFLAVFGICFQLYTEKGRSSFPPAPYAAWRLNRQLRPQERGYENAIIGPFQPTAPPGDMLDGTRARTRNDANYHIEDSEEEPLLRDTEHSQSMTQYQSCGRS
ncbi:transmembrane 7 superfamily member 3-like [Tachypleus tridentatus]|uniref:transmembrane 7 superfamily member 3-like n=1 Tax=Tachypleus tridentatus TaxID=6853 RepID=UPI003FD4195D